MNDTICLEAALLVEHEQRSAVGTKRLRSSVNVETSKESSSDHSIEDSWFQERRARIDAMFDRFKAPQ